MNKGFVCPICGSTREAGGSSCTGCPMSSKCGIVKCGNCGYSTVRAPSAGELVDRIKNIFRGGKHVGG